MKETIINILKTETKLKREEIENLIEIPPNPKMGDYAFPCFSLAKKLKKSPLEIAQDLTKELIKDETKEIQSIESKGPYVNFFVNKPLLANKVLKETKKKGWGTLKLDKKRIGIEYPAPNTNKPLHVGHLRNMAIGEAITRIEEGVGNKVLHLNLYNDRGVLISKSMIGYEKYGKNKTPKSENIKGDKFVGNFYVKFSKESAKDPKLEKEAQEKLKLWENNDPETLKLWKQMNNWAYKGMQETFDKFGLSKIDKNYYESELYKEGKEIIKDGLKRKVFQKKEDGAIFIDLTNEGLGEKIVLRSDKTSIYITQDLYLAEKKIKDFNLDSSYYIVGNDQLYHFKALFTILKKLGIKKDLHHFPYGMVALPSGKMKSREGTAPTADDLIEQTQEIAKKGLIERSTKLSKKETEERSLKIALAAIKYTLLKVDINKQLIFNPNEALAFEGDTGPYLLYSYARASSITRKANAFSPKSRLGSDSDSRDTSKARNKVIKIIDLKESEIELIKKIDSFPDLIESAHKHLAPNLIANYSYELSKQFNEFYHNCPVIGGIEEGFRLALVESFRTTLKKALNLLGIETLEEM
jgi:arginyl-tRNA synthetase